MLAHLLRCGKCRFFGRHRRIRQRSPCGRIQFTCLHRRLRTDRRFGWPKWIARHRRLRIDRRFGWLKRIVLQLKRLERFSLRQRCAGAFRVDEWIIIRSKGFLRPGILLRIFIVRSCRIAEIIIAQGSALLMTSANVSDLIVHQCSLYQESVYITSPGTHPQHSGCFPYTVYFEGKSPHRLTWIARRRGDVRVRRRGDTASFAGGCPQNT